MICGMTCDMTTSLNGMALRLGPLTAADHAA